MKVVIAPDKFKGSLDAKDAAGAIAQGISQAIPGADLDLCPVADGGEGTVAALGGQLIERKVTGPLPEMKIPAQFSILGDGRTAVVEMSSASGLRHLPIERRDPALTTTFGTGQLLMAAAELGVRRIILGLGGSATIDGGIGCAQACGLPVLLENGEPTAMTEPLTGRDLERVVLIKHGRGSAVERLEIEAACDVDIPLYDAPRHFGPQKGATAEQVKWFEGQFRRLAERCGKTEIAALPGAGAAGGLGFAMAAFFGARLRSGFELVAETVGLQKRLKGADLCITGEGRLDADTLRGKAAIGVARLCREAGVPCVALVGGAGAGAERAIDEGLTAFFCIVDQPMSERQSMESAASLLTRTAANVARLRLP